MAYPQERADRTTGSELMTLAQRIVALARQDWQRHQDQLAMRHLSAADRKDMGLPASAPTSRGRWPVSAGWVEALENLGKVRGMTRAHPQSTQLQEDTHHA